MMISAFFILARVYHLHLSEPAAKQLLIGLWSEAHFVEAFLRLTRTNSALAT
jgi:hypothetical protein